mgnify:CR=1 FL=1
MNLFTVHFTELFRKFNMHNGNEEIKDFLIKKDKDNNFNYQDRHLLAYAEIENNDNTIYLDLDNVINKKEIINKGDLRPLFIITDDKTLKKPHLYTERQITDLKRAYNHFIKKVHKESDFEY